MKEQLKLFNDDEFKFGQIELFDPSEYEKGVKEDENKG